MFIFSNFTSLQWVFVCFLLNHRTSQFCSLHDYHNYGFMLFSAAGAGFSLIY